MEEKTTDNRNTFAIKTFLKDYLDLRKDKDNELETVDSIRKGVEFKGANLWILIFAIFILVGIECKLHSRDYRCHAHLAADGVYHGRGAFCGVE